MAKQASNVLEFDINKYFGDLNKYVGELKTPNFDFEGIVAIQRKNFEALAAANKLAVEAVQAVLKRQADVVRQSIDEVSVAVREIATPGTAPEKAARQAELAKDAFERTVANLRELSEIVTKSNIEAGDLLNKRIVESLDELRTSLLKLK